MAPAETGTVVGVGAAGRMPSMEAEPKTLTLEQLKYAREAAMYVLSTKTNEEAIRIFTEGLKPVLGMRKGSAIDLSDDDVDIGSSEDSTPCSSRGGDGTGCRRHGRSIKRDIVTAPF